MLTSISDFSVLGFLSEKTFTSIVTTRIKKIKDKADELVDDFQQHLEEICDACGEGALKQFPNLHQTVVDFTRERLQEASQRAKRTIEDVVNCQDYISSVSAKQGKSSSPDETKSNPWARRTFPETSPVDIPEEEMWVKVSLYCSIQGGVLVEVITKVVGWFVRMKPSSDIGFDLLDQTRNGESDLEQLMREHGGIKERRDNLKKQLKVLKNAENLLRKTFV